MIFQWKISPFCFVCFTKKNHHFIYSLFIFRTDCKISILVQLTILFENATIVSDASERDAFNGLISICCHYVFVLHSAESLPLINPQRK